MHAYNLNSQIPVNMAGTCFEAAAMAYQARAEPDVAKTCRPLIGIAQHRQHFR